VITLTVIAFNDTPADGTLQVQFDELGGSIGRADTNQLVLPDPERMVSRVAAQVVYRKGAFAIIDRGSNPISLNGRALASGQETPLKAGDRVRICGYELAVSAGGTGRTAPADPFAGLLGPADAAPRAGAPAFDPLTRRATPAPPPAPAPPGGIPMDWDPFETSALQSARSGAAAAPRRDALGLDIGAAAPAALIPDSSFPSAAPSSLDQLFGLSPVIQGDPLASSVLDAPLAQPNLSADADPLRSLNSAPKASAPSEADQLSDLQRPFIPPTIIKPAAPGRVAPAAPGAVMSWVAQTEPAAAPPPPPTRSVASVRAPARPNPPVAAPFDEDVLNRPAVGAPVAPSAVASRAPSAAHSAPSEDSGALLDAFRRGLATPALELPALTPALMETIGALLHVAVQGTLELLNARAAVKHELRAEVTTIVPKNNNPLKFSPNAEVALQHLLAPPARGFIGAVPAMAGAYDDLRHHQFAFVAAMQAVLETSLQRFDPAALQSQLGDPSLLHSLLPASRNARLWEMFTEHYARIRGQATDDFHALFGNAFLTAYRAHVKRLQDQQAADRPEA